MDISNIKADKVNTTYGIKIGSDDAPVKVIEFINLKCPYCKMWYEDSKDLLTEYVSAGKVQRIVKHFDKEKPSLKKGNIIHQYLDYTNPEKALEEIDYFFVHQDEWGDLEDFTEIAAYATEKRNLSVQSNEAEAKGIVKEANEANVVFVPTVFIEDEIFDEHITQQELKELIDSRIK
ncbi:DsbA family protein [Carnobacterium inhibens]|uniref:Thioredoxin domain-containing protein n=1 Tax=Carnobacterium inhibens TaxID=147709 RepID=A0ABR7TEE7_9LACT|nr:DsbA family protein [Carnobacterium inhibens]MBC9825731.1 thioredoxin domain-containing protein [Carnobacterium inhibens]